jgi:hypothetical protein
MKNNGLTSFSHKPFHAALGLVAAGFVLTACNTTTQTASNTPAPAVEQKTDLSSLVKRWCGPAADPDGGYNVICFTFKEKRSGTALSTRLELQTNGRTATKGGVTSSLTIAGNKATIIPDPKVMSWQGKQYVLTHVLGTNTMTMKDAISGETHSFVTK